MISLKKVVAKKRSNQIIMGSCKRPFKFTDFIDKVGEFFY